MRPLHAAGAEARHQEALLSRAARRPRRRPPFRQGPRPSALCQSRAPVDSIRRAHWRDSISPRMGAPARVRRPTEPASSTEEQLRPPVRTGEIQPTGARRRPSRLHSLGSGLVPVTADAGAAACRAATWHRGGPVLSVRFAHAGRGQSRCPLGRRGAASSPQARRAIGDNDRPSAASPAHRRGRVRCGLRHVPRRGGE